MQGNTVLVTGAASGIGMACVQRLLRSGAQVVGIDVRDMDHLEEGGPFRPVRCDVSSAYECENAVAFAAQAFGKVDALIHCAAIHSTADWERLTGGEFERVLSVNVTGSFLISQAAGRLMTDAGEGAIVLASSANVLLGGLAARRVLGALPTLPRRPLSSAWCGRLPGPSALEACA